MSKAYWQIYWRSILAVTDGEFKPFRQGKIIVEAVNKGEASYAFLCAVSDLFGEKARVVSQGITECLFDADDSGESAESTLSVIDIIRKKLEQYYAQDLRIHPNESHPS